MEQGFKVRIQGDNQDLDQAIEKSQASLKGFMSDIGGAVKNIGELKMEYRALSRTSLEGKTPQEVDKIIGRLVELKDQIGDTENMLNSLSGDNFEKVGEAAQSASTMIAGVTGAMSLFGAEGEKLNELTQKTIGLLAIARAAQEATVMFSERAYGIIIKQKYNEISARLKEALTIKSVTAASIAENTAKTKGIATTNLITKAQRVWNATVAANPLLALVAAILAVGTAAYALSKRFGEAKNAQADFNKAADGTVIKNKELRESYNENLKAIREITYELAVMRGEMTQQQVDLLMLDEEFSETMDNIADETEEAMRKTTNSWRGAWKFWLAGMGGVSAATRMHLKDIAQVHEDSEIKKTAATELYEAKREQVREKYKKAEVDRTAEANKLVEDLEIKRMSGISAQLAKLKLDYERNLTEWEGYEQAKTALTQTYEHERTKIIGEAEGEAMEAAKKALDGIEKHYEDEANKVTLEFNAEIDWGEPLEDIEVVFIEIADKLLDVTEQVNDIISDGVADFTASLAEGVGLLASGEGTMEDVLAGVAGSVANFMDTLGKSLIATGMASEAFKSVMLSGAGAIAAGAALVALAAVTRAKFAAGPAGAGSVAMPSGAAARSSVGGAYGSRELGEFSVNVKGELVASGSDLVAVIDSENKRMAL